MAIGKILLWLTILPISSGIWYSWKNFREDFTEKYRDYAKKSVYLTTFFFSSSFVVFIYYCVTANKDIFYSYWHSMPSYEWYYKLSSVWAGRTGSVFLWIFLIIASMAISEYVFSRKDLETKKLQDYARPILLIITLLFLGILLSNKPFVPTASKSGLLAEALKYDNIPNNLSILLDAQWGRGSGMNSQLISPWMIIHPPILFLGYALFTVPFASSLIFGITGRNDWYKLSEFWSRIGWLFLTLGIAIGAVWAYVTLGWGGYWAWDPVESSSLLPWLTATAYLHLQSRYKVTDEYKYLTHVFIFSTFSLIIFATLITRGGIVVSGSVHAYPSPLPQIRNLLYWVLLVSPIALGSLIIWKRLKINKKH